MAGIRVEVVGRVLHATLADPARGNALDRAAVSALLDAIRQHRGRAEILVLRGEGDVFSRGRPRPAGGPAPAPHSSQDIREALSDLAELNQEIRHWPGVAAAGVQGGAWGAACGLLVHCDVVIAEDEARFGFPEITYDLPPGLVSAYLPKWISAKAAHYLALTGREIPAPLALAWGLVNEVVATGSLAGRLEELVGFFESRRPGALRACKEALLECRRLPDEQAYPRGIERVMEWVSRGPGT